MGAMLEARGLSKRFGGLRAVDDLSLTVDAGSIVGLIGPNGAGKTTVFNLVTGQLRPSAGEVHFKGRRITGMPPHELVRLGLVRTFQSMVLYSEASVLGNGLRVGGRALELLHFGELAAVRDELARNLPYGHQRALGVAIGLATDPALLMLDEPVAGGDPQGTGPPG